MEIMDFVNQLMSSFDFAYMFAVNIATYIFIKCIDVLNGNKVVATWQKRIVAVIVGILIGLVVIKFGSDKKVIFYSFFVSLLSWDTVFKPILNILNEKFNYRKEVK